MADEGSVVGSAVVRLRPSTTNFAAEASAKLDPELAAVEGKINASSGRVGGVMSGLSRNLGSFGIPFAGALDSVDRSLQKTTGTAQTFAAKLSSFGALEVVALGAVAVAGVDMAMKAEASQARLAGAVAATHATYAQYADQIDKTESSQRKLGFTDTSTEDSLAKLTIATHSVKAATADESLASDISRGRKIDLSSATDILVKVETGHVALLARLGLATKDAAGHTITQKAAIAELSQYYGGDAARFAGTFAGSLAALQAQGEHLGVAIGTDVIPVITTFAHDLVTGVSAIESVNKATHGWAGEIALVGAAIPIAVLAGTKLWSVGGTLVDQYGKLADWTGRATAAITGSATAQDALTAATTASADASVASSAGRATAEETVAAAIAQRVAAEETANAADAVTVAKDVAVVSASELRAAADAAVMDAEAALAEAQAFGVNASVAQASAAQALAAVQDELSASFEISDVALTQLNVTTAAATAAALAQSAAYEVETAAVAHLAAAEEVAATTAKGLSVSSVAAGAGMGGAAVGSAALAGSLAVLYGNYRNAETVTNGNIISLKGYASTIAYTASLMPGASLAADVWGHALGLLGDGHKKNTAATKDDTLAGAQDALSKAQATLAADQLSGKTSKLAADKEAVTAASTKLAGAENLVTQATQAGAGATSTAITPLEKYNNLLNQFIVDGRSSSTVAGTLAKDISALIDAAQGSASAQAALTSRLDKTGIAATITRGDVVSLAEAEAALGNYSANAVASYGNLSQAASVQFDANAKAASSTDAYKSAVDALSQSQSGGSGGGGGAAGATKNATQAYIDQQTKVLALSSAQQQVAASTLGVRDAQVQLAQAEQTKMQSVTTLSLAEKNYATVLHGVAADSRAARDATMALNQARNDEKSQALAVADAERALKIAKNDQQLNKFGVSDAQNTLSASQTAAGTANQNVTNAETQLAAIRANSAANAMDVATAEAAVTAARAAASPLNEQVTKDEVALQDARITATGNTETVTKAEIDLSNQKITAKQKTTDLTTAEKFLSDTLHGYPPHSVEAQKATQDLITAQLGARTAADGLITAQQGVQGALDQTKQSALGVFRAQADINGLLNQPTASASAAAIKSFGDVQTKMAAVKQAAITMATDIGAQVTQTYALPQAGIYAEAKVLENLGNANPLLKTAFASVLAALEKDLTAMGPIPVDLMGPSGKTIANSGPHAAGGRMGPDEWGTAGEAGAETFHTLPGGGVDIFSHAKSTSMGSRSSGGGPTAAEIGAELARHLAPLIKGGLTIQNNGDFVALNPDELASEAARKISFQLAGKL